MLTELELRFTNHVLYRPPDQITEEFASESHETRRIPDPYIFVLQNGKLITPNGKIVENSMDTTSYVGAREATAFRTIQQWCEDGKSGFVVWLSPPFPEKYPVSKAIISEIFDFGGVKGLFNRAIVLDINASELLSVANILSENHLISPESLRETPIFPTQERLTWWLDKLRLHTNQINLVDDSKDILYKTDTYAQVSDLLTSVSVYGNRRCAQLYRAADENGLIGKNVDSCTWVTNSSGNTPFEKFITQALPASEKKILCCTCPHCGKKVEAEIYDGKIHCPKPPGCGASASWKD